MRTASTTLALAAALSCAHRPPLAPSHHLPVPASADAGPPPRVVRRREPEAAPAEFADHVLPVDVDGDGAVDLVRSFPVLPPSGSAEVSFSEMPPALVAHRLGDGRYALDDEVTRAALRSLCPARQLSPRVTPPPGSPADADRARVPFVEMLFIDGFCHRVWGASVDEAVARVRDTATAAPDGIIAPTQVDAVVTALRAFPVPVALEPIDAPPLPLVPTAPEPAAPEGPQPPRDARCAALDRANAAVATRANRAIDRVSQDGVTGHLRVDGEPLCVATAQGLWALALEGFRVDRGDQEAVRSTAVLSWRPLVGPATAGVRFELSATGYSRETTALVPAADYDGDGVPEVIVHRVEGAFEGGASSSHTVYTVRAGAVERYAPASRFTTIDRVVDADRDGRPDLVLPSPWLAVSECGYMGEDHPGPALLAHSLPDGTFSTADGVARAWTAAQCTRPPRGEDPVRPDVLDVACARLGGASPEAVIAALQVRSPAGFQRVTDEVRRGHCLTFQQIATVALLALPFEPVR
ncbi:MAG: hypothetical protein Q8S73_17275 [Deltaproteobacteria bacterium]|nr:hypothetical protein [Myxococcales bacterium]MDP3215861.1 hypothetical protein [Deltaproteobacteria bacterium]